MALIVNDRDNLIVNAGVRDIDPRAGKYVRLTAVPAMFRVSAGGIPSPATITLEALPVNINGTVTFTASNGATLKGTGNTRTLDFIDMQADVIQITATMVYDGQTYTDKVGISKLQDSEAGTGGDGPAGTQYQTARLYKWSTASSMALPTGKSTLTWGTGANTSYVGTDGWYTTVPANPGTSGVKLWEASKPVSAPGGSFTTEVNYATGATVAVLSQNGEAGPAGIRSAQAKAYRWGDGAMPTIAGTATFTYATNTYDTVPPGWTKEKGNAASLGLTLYEATVNLVDAAGATTSAINWVNAAITAIGYLGLNGQPGVTGDSVLIAYTLIDGNSLAQTPDSAVRPDKSLPAIGTWGETRAWTSQPVLPGAGQSVWQSNGIYNSQLKTTTWSVPYLSNLRVGSLSAITTNFGKMLAGEMDIGAGKFKVGPNGDADMRSLTIRDTGGNVLITSAVPEILGSFALRNQNALMVGTVNDGLVIGSAGLYGRKGGKTEFSINSDGSAHFSGTLGANIVKADNIDSRGLTVRKLDGTLLLGVGGLAAEALPAGTKNSEIVVGGRNLCPDGDFERGFHQVRGVAGASAVSASSAVGAISGTKSLFIEGTGADMYAYLTTRISVTPGREYRISFYSKSATSGVITGSSSYILLWNGPDMVVHTHLPMDNLGVGSWKRQVVAWTCPPGVTHVEPRFGFQTNGAYSWLAIDCLQIEEGNTVTQWTPAIEDILGDSQAKANAAQAAAIADANEKLAAKMNRGNDVLGGVIAVDAVNAPAGFRAGPLSWNAAGDYTSGYGTALTPKGLIGYNTAGRRTFMVNGQTGDVQLYGDLMGGSYTEANWPTAGGLGYFLGHVGLFLGNPSTGKYVRIGSDGNMYLPGFTHENGQLTLTNTVIVTPKLRTDFFITVPNLYLNSQVNTNSYQQYAVSATLNNGTGPYRYSWSFQVEEGDIAMAADPSNTNGIVRSRGTNRVCSGFLTCTVTDANGATHSDSGYIRIQFGSGVPV